MDFKFLLFMLERKHAVKFHYPFHLKLGKKQYLHLFLLEQAIFNLKKKSLITSSEFLKHSIFIYLLKLKKTEVFQLDHTNTSKTSLCWCLVAKSCLTLFVIPWTVGSSVHGISQKDYWSRLTFPHSGDLPDPGIKPMSPAPQADSLPLNHREG